MMMGSGSTPTPTPAPQKEIAELASRAEALRAAIARAQHELEAVSTEEKAISDRIALLRSPPAPGPLAQREADDAEWRPPTDPAYRPNPKKQRIQADWVRAPFVKKTNDFEKPPTPRTPKVEQTKTVLVQRFEPPGVQRRDAWKIAAAGAGLAALLGSIAIAVYFEMIPKPPPPPTPKVVTRTPARTPPTPTTDPLPSTVPTVSAPAPAPVATTPPTFTSPFRRRVPPPSPPPPAPRTTSADEADRILNGALGAPTGLGAITVVCTPKCDQTIDNGSPLGPGHIFNRPVPTGRHVLQLSASNGAKKTVTINVAEGATREIRAAMDAPAPPPSAPLPAPITPPPLPDPSDRF